MVFFPAHPVFRFLSDETRDKIMFNVPRETQRIKLIQLLSEIDAISSEIEYNYKLNQQRIPITHKTITKLVNLAQSLSFLINALMVVFYAVVISEQQ
jgi:inositol 1,4,5-triphosphate receptor type 1/inositol 1,4,5-triphosphate receptor type 3